MNKIMKNDNQKKFIKLISIASVLIFMVFFSLFVIQQDGKISKPLFCQLSKISFINKALSESCPAGQYWKCGGCFPSGYSACTDSNGGCILCGPGWVCAYNNGGPICQIPPSSGGGSANTGNGGTGGTSTNCSNCWFDISANPTTITAGQCTNITWNSGPLGNWVLGSSENIWTGNISGSQQKCPTSTTRYSLGIMCKNSCGQKTDSVTVTVNPASQQTSTSTSTPTVITPAIISFSANPSLINPGGSSTLSWNTANATIVTITAKTASGAVNKMSVCASTRCFAGTVGSNGSTVVNPSETTTYTLSAQNSGKTVEKSTTITVISSTPSQASQPAPSTSTPSTTACNNMIPRCMGYYCAGGQWVCPGVTGASNPPATSPTSQPTTTQTSPSIPQASGYTFTMTKNYCGTNGQISEFITTVPANLYNALDVRLTADNVGVVQGEKKQSYSIARSSYQDLTDKRFSYVYFDLMYGNGFTDPNIKWATPIVGNGATAGQIPAGLLPVSHGALIVPILDCPTPTTAKTPDMSIYSTPSPTPSPTPTSTSTPAQSTIATSSSIETESSQTNNQCQEIEVEGTIKFDQARNQYFIAKSDESVVMLSINPDITINLVNYLNHKVKATGCLSNNILLISKINITDNPDGNKTGSIAISSATINTTQLVSTGGDLAFNIFLALLISGIIGYIILKPGKRADY